MALAMRLSAQDVEGLSDEELDLVERLTAEDDVIGVELLCGKDGKLLCVFCHFAPKYSTVTIPQRAGTADLLPRRAVAEHTRAHPSVYRRQIDRRSQQLRARSR